MSDTPKTDAAIINFEYEETWLGGERGSDSKEIIEPDFCRSLERKYNTLIAKLEALANVWNDLRKDYLPYTDDREDGEITGKQMCAEELRKIIQESK